MTPTVVRVRTRADRPWQEQIATLTVPAPDGWDTATLERELARLGPLQLTSRVVPTVGLAVAVGAAGVLQLLGRTTGSSWLALASAAVGVLPIVAVLLRPRLDDLQVERLLHGRGAVGASIQTTLVVTNRGRRSSPALSVCDLLPGHEHVHVDVPPLSPGGSASAQLARAVQARTASLGGRITLTASSPVGMLTARRDVAMSGEVRAYPEPVPAPSLRPSGGVGTPARSRSQPGSGVELLGLRDWRPGDGGRAVSARASARHGRPLVRERERDAEPALVVLLMPIAVDTDPPVREAALAAAATLAMEASRRGRPVSVLGPPGPQRPRGRQVLDAFAAADLIVPESASSMSAALAAAGRGGQLVIVVSCPIEAKTAAAAHRRAAAAGCELVILGG